MDCHPSTELFNQIVERRLRLEIEKGVQTIQYQVITLMTTNGQAPFLTVFMYLNEARNEQEMKDLALIIEETLRQRYQGVKNEAGVWITPAFPKLIYVLEEDNIREGTEYFYLTQLAAGLHLRKKDEGAEGRQLFPSDGMPQRTESVEGRKRELQVLRSVQSRCCNHQSAGRGAELRQGHGQVLADFRRAVGAVLSCADVPS